MSRLSGSVFDNVTFTPPQQSTFNGNHDIKTSCRIGEVFPLEAYPVYPKDRFQFKYNMQAKFNPLIAPAFQRMSIKKFFFYARNSDLWDNFDHFFTGIDPKSGKTAYAPTVVPPAHPHFKLNAPFQVGNAYLGVKLNLSGVDLSSAILETDEKFTISSAVVNNCIEQIKSNPEAITWHYEDGSDLKSLYSSAVLRGPSSTQTLDTSIDTKSWYGFPPDDSGRSTFILTLNTFTGSDTTTTSLKSKNVFFNSKIRGFKALCHPSSTFDYLDYPCADLRHYINSQKFLDDCDKHSESFPSLANYFYQFYIKNQWRMWTTFAQSGEFNPDAPMPCNGWTHAPMWLDTSDYSYSEAKLNNIDYVLESWYSTGSGDDVHVDQGSQTIRQIIMRYLVWMYFSGYNTTQVVDAPYFMVCPISEFVHFSEKNIDSLRYRAYWKIWNEYFRDSNLTAEFPVPYSSNGYDFANIVEALFNFLNQNNGVSTGLPPMSTMDHYFDFRGDDIINLWQEVYPNAIDQKFAYDRDGRIQLLSYYMYKLLTKPFKHVRRRDYLTGALPNTSVVQVVAPVIAQQNMRAYEDMPYTNLHQTSPDGTTIIQDNTDIKPVPADTFTGSTSSSPIGWLDLENLRITQKLKQYFQDLRHAMAGIKDYIKIFFDVDIDDLTLHRAKFLGGDEQLVSVSEILSTSETENQPLGSLAGRATSYGETGTYGDFYKEAGQFIALACLSPVSDNIGGLDRQLIRDSKFDYFQPQFAELGDMSIEKVEVTASPWMRGSAFKFQDTYGYTQRYMDLKFMRNKVHSDFLGALSDWHLDLLQPAIQSDDINLSQSFIEERDDDRIFSDVDDEACNCFIWCECDCTYQRALPIILHSVLG